MVYIVTGAFIILDLITGLVKAVKDKKYKSTKMRTGLFHKCGSLLCIVFGCLVDYAQNYIDIGITIPVAIAVCAYIVIMEIGSIIENIIEINPEIMPEKLKGIFSIFNDKE